MKLRMGRKGRECLRSSLGGLEITIVVEGVS
mgnify:CR=1 FL=1